MAQGGAESAIVPVRPPSLESSDGGALSLIGQSLMKTLLTEHRENFEIDGVKFDVMTPEEVPRYAEVQIQNREMYYQLTSKPMPFGVLDQKMGPNKLDSRCTTCGQGLQDCAGHWGFVHLYHPVYHVGYLKHLLNVLYCICKKCSRLLLPAEKQRSIVRAVRSCGDPIVKRAIFRATVTRCKKESKCYHCGAPQGILRKVMKPSLDQFMKIVHQVKVKESQNRILSTIQDDLDPRYVRQLLEQMRPPECEVLDVVRPEKLLISAVLVPPNCIRPSVVLGDSGSNEDDLTVILSEIVELNKYMEAQSQQGLPAANLLSTWEFLQLQCARFINSDAPAVGALLATKNISKPGRGICQRLKGDT